MQIEAVKELLDRPIAYHGILAKTLGSVPAAVMLSQGIYWQKIAEKKGADWFWVTAKDWFDQTGIKADAQLTARAVLKKSGCWHERLFDLPAKMHYRIDVSALLNVISEYLNSGEQVAGNPGNRMPGTPRTASGKFRQLKAGNPGDKKEITDTKKEISDREAKTEFSPVADYAEPMHKIETFEPSRMEYLNLEAEEKQTTSNGAARREMTAEEWDEHTRKVLTGEAGAIAETDLEALERMLKEANGGKVVFVDSIGEVVPNLKGSRPAKTVKMPQHANGSQFGAFKPFDIEAEFAALKTDLFLKESFVLNDRIPAEKFDEYTSLFPVWSRGKGETYNNRKELRGHFHGWARGHYLGEQKAAAKTPLATTDNLPRRAEPEKKAFF